MTAPMPFDGRQPPRAEDSEVDDIIYRISHDLRASVRALQELPCWILEDLEKAAIRLPAPTARHLELMNSHACRLDTVLSGLLEYARVGRMQPVRPLKPKEVLEAVIEDLGIADGIVVDCDVDHGCVQMGEADLHRIFAIPISNAVRFHPKKAPRIEISAGPVSARHWQFEVTDNGPGIPEAMRDLVFRPMTKLVSRDLDEGAGMGLAVLRKIAACYEGTVGISTPRSGKGTTVRLRLAAA